MCENNEALSSAYTSIGLHLQYRFNVDMFALRSQTRFIMYPQFSEYYATVNKMPKVYLKWIICIFAEELKYISSLKEWENCAIYHHYTAGTDLSLLARTTWQ